MNQLNITPDFPFKLLFEMGKENPEILKNTTFNIAIPADQFLSIFQTMEKNNEALLARYFERMLRDDQSLKYVTTQELKESYNISRQKANELQHDGVFSTVTRLGRQNAYLRKEVQAYVSDVKAHQKVSPT